MAALNKSNNSVVSADEKNRRVQKILNRYFYFIHDFTLITFNWKR